LVEKKAWVVRYSLLWYKNGQEVGYGMRSFSEAFKETMFRFKLSGADISEKSGLTPSQISNFRNGHNLRADSVEKLLAAMPPDARRFMVLFVIEETSEESLVQKDP
jgi:transcriptional regulator with XRE-family HTH domain